MLAIGCRRCRVRREEDDCGSPKMGKGESRAGGMNALRRSVGNADKTRPRRNVMLTFQDGLPDFQDHNSLGSGVQGKALISLCLICFPTRLRQQLSLALLESERRRLPVRPWELRASERLGRNRVFPSRGGAAAVFSQLSISTSIPPSIYLSLGAPAQLRIALRSRVRTSASTYQSRGENGPSDGADGRTE